ncbi:MAG: hypothetical protein JRH15_07345 [Deltaproteobacteria bacterium]|nr:hypothetical protein [Deltaproteobacteria bacterium]
MQASELTVVLLVFIGIPLASSAVGPHGAYVAMGAIGILALPLLLWLPKQSPTGAREQSERLTQKNGVGGIAILLFIALFLEVIGASGL